MRMTQRLTKPVLLSALNLLFFNHILYADTVMDPTYCVQIGNLGELTHSPEGITNTSLREDLTVSCPIANHSESELNYVSFFYATGLNGMKCALVRTHWDYYLKSPVVQKKWGNARHTISEFFLETIWAGTLGNNNRDVGTSFNLECIIPSLRVGKESVLGAYYYQ